MVVDFPGARPENRQPQVQHFSAPWLKRIVDESAGIV
jgi:hypothetical protein